MVKHVGDINGIPLYVDEHMEKDKIIKGRKGNSTESFVVVHPKIAKTMLHAILIKERKEKLERLNSLI